MDRDAIAVIEIDGAGRLHVVPSSRKFPFVYREAMEVQWDTSRCSLHSPAPRDWSYARWFQQVLAAAREQGCELYPAESTRWLNVGSGTKAELLQVVAKEA
ncbi:hypothetical protein ACFONC_07345 [Luteimonas soli]|uniref:Integron Cassette Protein Hfx-Cass5 domain-containing protein n=1 Tax=Luteimonas soli TaxID=1648966 RepID=A0ABV7XIH2_9GAMM